jgi:hypothetical protein
MKIKITDNAIKYLEKKKEKIITIDLFVAGCCVEIGEPIIKLGTPPQDLHKYNVFYEGEYTIYFYKGADVREEGITITLNKFLGMESLEVKGINLL